MAKQAIKFETSEVELALIKMGISQKDISSGKDLLRFLDDQDRCRTFCGYLQGEDAIKRSDPTFMERYQARAERLIREFASMPMHKQLDTKNERYVDDMAKSSAKKKTAAKEVTVKTTKTAPKPKLVATEGEPKWFNKFARRGIAFRMAVLLHRAKDEPIPGESKASKLDGATKAELLEDLKSSFSDHAESSLANNINVEISALQKRIGKKLARIEDPKRGLVYKFA